MIAKLKTLGIMRPGGGGGNWWEVSGKTCLGAWCAVGVESYEESKLDLSDAGENLTDGAEFPTWDTVNGWLYEYSTKRLLTTIVPSDTITVIVQHVTTDGGGYHHAIGSSLTSPDNYRMISVQNRTRRRYYKGDAEKHSVGYGSGIQCMAGNKCYFDGVLEATLNPTVFSPSTPLAIGNLYSPPISGYNHHGSIQRVAMYAETLSDSEVSTLTTAMAALS
jgi:hypothetical protein